MWNAWNAWNAPVLGPICLRLGLNWGPPWVYRGSYGGQFGPSDAFKGDHFGTKTGSIFLLPVLGPICGHLGLSWGSLWVYLCLSGGISILFYWVVACVRYRYVFMGVCVSIAWLSVSDAYD